MKVITHSTLALLLVIPVFLLGCQSDTVEFDEGEMLTFEGILETFTQIDTYSFVVTSQGTVRIELTELDTRIGDTGEPVESEGIGVGFGRPNAAENCTPTVSRLLQETEAISVFAPEGVYCLGVFVPGGVYPIGTVLQYTIELVSGA
ncbi:MAG: hypothetical protein WBH85_07955 [Thermoanaerobaculia bacterium]